MILVRPRGPACRPLRTLLAGLLQRGEGQRGEETLPRSVRRSCNQKHRMLHVPSADWRSGCRPSSRCACHRALTVAPAAKTWTRSSPATLTEISRSLWRAEPQSPPPKAQTRQLAQETAPIIRQENVADIKNLRPEASPPAEPSNFNLVFTGLEWLHRFRVFKVLIKNLQRIKSIPKELLSTYDAEDLRLVEHNFTVNNELAKQNACLPQRF